MFIKGLLLLLAASSLSAGRLLPQPESRIIGGYEINIEQAPWQVSLRHFGGHICGGSIYNETIIITAAHCLYDKETKTLRKAENFEVLAGSANIFSSKTIVKVAAIKPHEGYNSSFYDHDIGIVKLSEPLDLTTPNMQRIALADIDPAPGTRALVTGWGTAQRLFWFSEEILPGTYIPSDLQAIDIKIRKRAYCGAMLKDVYDYMICGGSAGSTTCQGDSGGPLVINKKLVGVVSRGDPHCASLTVYTSVSQLYALL